MPYLFLILLSFISIASHSKTTHEVSFSLIDLDSQKIFDQKEPNASMVLASVSKLYSLPFSLEKLGPQYQFETKLFIKGKIKNGILNGDLYLVGGADPYLTSAHLMSLAQALLNKNIFKINGQFYFNQSYIPLIKNLDNIGLEDQPDNPSLSALNVEFNRFNVNTKNNLTIPNLEHIKIEESKKKLVDLNYTYEKSKFLEERWKKLKKTNKSWESLPAKNSGLFTAHYLKYLAEIMGVNLPQPKELQELSSKGLKLLSRHKSLPLIELSTLAMEYSNNLMAELPYLVARKESSQNLNEWLKKRFPKIKWKKTHLKNGSGLSYSNKTSPSELSLFLKNNFKTMYNDRSFMSLLSTVGHSGWLKNRLKTPNFAFHVWAKTGSLHYVDNIAGYLFTKSGKRLAFNILIQNADNLEILKNNRLSKRAKNLRKSSKKWSFKAKQIQNQLMQKWINTI